MKTRVMRFARWNATFCRDSRRRASLSTSLPLAIRFTVPCCHPRHLSRKIKGSRRARDVLHHRVPMRFVYRVSVYSPDLVFHRNGRRSPPKNRVLSLSLGRFAIESQNLQSLQERERERGTRMQCRYRLASHHGMINACAKSPFHAGIISRFRSVMVMQPV